MKGKETKMKEMTKERLQEIKKRMNRASPGPWSNAEGTDIYIGATKIYPGVTTYQVQLGSMELDVDCGRNLLSLSSELKDEHFFDSANYDEDEEDADLIEDQSLANANFVANAPQDIADLIAYVEFLEREMLLNQAI